MVGFLVLWNIGFLLFPSILTGFKNPCYVGL